MKYLLLLLLMTGCSLIKIQEASQPEKHRPEILTIYSYGCIAVEDSKDCKDIIEISISRSKIIYFTEDKGNCFVKFVGDTFPQRLNMTCNEFKEFLNQ